MRGDDTAKFLTIRPSYSHVWPIRRPSGQRRVPSRCRSEPPVQMPSSIEVALKRHGSAVTQTAHWVQPDHSIDQQSAAHSIWLSQAILTTKGDALDSSQDLSLIDGNASEAASRRLANMHDGTTYAPPTWTFHDQCGRSSDIKTACMFAACTRA